MGSVNFLFRHFVSEGRGNLTPKKQNKQETKHAAVFSVLLKSLQPVLSDRLWAFALVSGSTLSWFSPGAAGRPQLN